MADSSRSVPFIDLKRFNSCLRDSVLKDWERIFDQTEFVGGPSVQKLEAKLGERLEIGNVVACANGTDALIIGLQAIGVRPGDRVAIPNLTFWATYEAVAAIGAVPVLVDVSEADLQMDFDAFRAAFDQFQFRAAILVHLYGWCSARLGEFRDFAEKNGIRMLEDGAQAFGTLYEGKSVFNGALAATLSFYPAKVLGGAMDGGAILSRDASVMNLARTLCNHGRLDHYRYSHVGWNSRMGGLQASYLLRALEQIDGAIESRRGAFEFYREAVLREAGDRKSPLRFHDAPSNVRTNGYLAVLSHETLSGDEMVARMKKRGMGCGRVYPESLDVQPPAKDALRASSLAVSRELCAKVFSPPLFNGILKEECEWAAHALSEAIHETV